jgi:hypothetical protein
MSFLEYLQSRSDQTKSKIITSVVIILIIVLGSFWLFNLKGITRGDLLPSGEEQGSVLSATNRISIESMETKNDKRYLYFKIENNTSDILNFAPMDKITLNVGSELLKLENIVDRQRMPFVKKVLSNQTLYGILIFPNFEGKTGTLTFDNMYFESNQSQIFKETSTVDFSKLKPLEELRS